MTHETQMVSLPIVARHRHYSARRRQRLGAGALAGYTLDWWTADGGGGASTGGSYSLDGTIGQPDAGTSTGGTHALSGGFWGGGAANQYDIYLPLVLR